MYLFKTRHWCFCLILLLCIFLPPHILILYRQVQSIVREINKQYDINLTNSGTDWNATSDLYPYIPFNVIKECGLSDHVHTSGFSLTHPLTKSLAFVKTHKTGSSTIANIINQIVDGRRLIKMIPKNFVQLGWPREFPGKVRWINRASKYDAINNHAVWNATSFAYHLKDPMFAFTILREPLSQTNNGSTEFDNNIGHIRSFIANLDLELDVVMIIEHLEKSLLMLVDNLPNLDLTELVWNDMKVQKKSVKVFPNSSELEELRTLLLVDQMIYDHFNQKLTKWWTSRNNHTQLDIKKNGLTCLHRWASINREKAKDSLEYTTDLWEKQANQQQLSSIILND